MRVINGPTASDWAKNLPTVADYFKSNPGQTVAACVAATGLTAPQIYWALGQLGLIAVAETDSEFMAHHGHGRRG